MQKNITFLIVLSLFLTACTGESNQQYPNSHDTGASSGSEIDETYTGNIVHPSYESGIR